MSEMRDYLTDFVQEFTPSRDRPTDIPEEIITCSDDIDLVEDEEIQDGDGE